MRNRIAPPYSIETDYTGEFYIREGVIRTYNDLLLALTLIDGVGPHIIKKIITQVCANTDQTPGRHTDIASDMQYCNRCFLLGNQSAERFFSLSQKELEYQYALTSRQARLIFQGLKNTDVCARERNLCARNNVKLLTLFDQDYPFLLRQITTPPAVLWVQSCLFDLQKNICVALVGSREASYYGKLVIEKLVPDLVRAGCTLVSGGARGIDTWAHEETLTARGKTLVILGSGLGHYYPARNKKLFDQIVKSGGTLISPFPFDTRPAPKNFPARNRIIAGMSLVTVVIQAAEKSGALITAEYATQNNREVCAVPGPITEITSRGTNRLIAQGAPPVLCAHDILRLIGRDFSNANDSIERKNTPDRVRSHDQKKPETLMGLLGQRPYSIEELALRLGKPESEIQAELFSLQLKGSVRMAPGNKWALS